jgi:DNA processing protein
MQREELEAWLRLQCTAGVGPSTARKLLAEFGLPEDIFAQPHSHLEACVGPKVACALLSVPPELQSLAHTSYQWLRAEPESRRCLTLSDADYPKDLLQLEDPPCMLWAMGSAALWERGGINAVTSRCIAMVGSRNPTPQGLDNARQFAAALAYRGLCIVSGLAMGVDGAAHEGALEGAPDSDAATIAVVGTGLDRVYPKDHRDLAHRIAQHGLLISEFNLGTPPLSANFPRRNRIISGLSRGTLVVEAALKSGSLITARMAVEQGRDVFSIPGSIHSTQSRGCHALIKQGAKLVENAQDVMDELSWEGSPANVQDIAPESTGERGADDLSGAGLTPAEIHLLAALGFEASSLDALQARTGLDTPTLQAHLMALELSNRVRRLPGGLFQRLQQA